MTIAPLSQSPENGENKYQYNGKEHHADLGLNWTDYGARWYDAQLGRWHSVDPLAEEFVGWSPYNYVMNNPTQMVDPDGRGPVKGLKALYNVGKRAYQTYKKTGKLNAKSIGNAAKEEVLSIVDNVSTIVDSESSTGDKVLAAFDLVTGFGGEAKAAGNALGLAGDAKKVGTFKVDRKLPRKKDGTPDASADGATGAHTQLGEKKGRKETYNQAREFDDKGNVVKDIDFTDHGRPNNHPNPHQHRYGPNETGGTPKRSKKAEPLNNERNQ